MRLKLICSGTGRLWSLDAKLKTLILFFLCTSSQLIAFPAIAGPPFQTDDPEPVDYLHWEIYVASIQEYQRLETDATLPHIEINYGVVPNVQLHLIAPMGYVNGMSGAKYGYSNTEIGVKYRFVQDTDNALQIGVFPLVELPTGDRAVSSGSAQVYLPLWVQKSWGKFTTYGGAGYWLNYGVGNKNWIFAGWEAQYDFSKALTLGGETYYHTPQTVGAQSGAGFNVGGIVNVDDHNHILFSAGHSVSGVVATTVYVGYQFTI